MNQQQIIQTSFKAVYRGNRQWREPLLSALIPPEVE
jgi:hypothetical protein